MRTLFVVFTILCILSVQSQANTWGPAKERQYSSSNNSFLLRVVPINMVEEMQKIISKEQMDAYLRGKLSREQERRLKELNYKARAILLKKVGRQQFQKIWENKLVNQISPVKAIVSNNGKYVVTFDNWHAKGWGSDVVVIYGSKGQLIKKFSLKDFTTEEERKNFNRSVSSIHWGGQHRISENNKFVILNLLSGLTNYKRKIQLSNGKVIYSKF